MSILKYYKDNSALTFNELMELSKLNEADLLSEVEKQISSKRLSLTSDDTYVLYKHLAVGKLDVKETFAFLLQAGEDLFLQEKDISDSLDNDIVLVHVGKTNKVIEVLERSLTRIVVHVSKIRS